MKLQNHFWLAALLLALPLAAQAERYRVDLILYQDKTGAGGERSIPARAPDLRNVFELSDVVQLRNNGIEILPDEAFGLSKEWRHLVNSQRHQPLVKLAWIQKDPPADNGPGLRLRSGSPMALTTTTGGSTRAVELYPIDGSVRLLMGRFLHIDADLAYTVSLDNGELGSYRMEERRRMRRDELHHLDSPRLGILARVMKADSPKK